MANLTAPIFVGAVNPNVAWEDPQLMKREPITKSFASVLCNKSPTIIPLKKVSNFKGEPAINFSMEDITKLSEPYKYTIVGKFSHGNPGKNAVCKMINFLDLKASVSIGMIDYKHILIRCHHEDDFLRLCLRKVWSIQGYPMRTFKWSYDFHPYKESSFAPIWIKLILLPIHLYNNSSIFSIASVFGRPLKLDGPTAALTRPSLARVCVEVDLKKELIHRVHIGYGDKGEGFWQYCEYENVPEYCTLCNKKGHGSSKCKLVQDYEVNDNVKQGASVVPNNRNQHISKKDLKQQNNINVNQNKGLNKEWIIKIKENPPPFEKGNSCTKNDPTEGHLETETIVEEENQDKANEVIQNSVQGAAEHQIEGIYKNCLQLEITDLNKQSLQVEISDQIDKHTSKDQSGDTTIVSFENEVSNQIVEVSNAFSCNHSQITSTSKAQDAVVADTSAATKSFEKGHQSTHKFSSSLALVAFEGEKSYSDSEIGHHFENEVYYGISDEDNLFVELNLSPRKIPGLNLDNEGWNIAGKKKEKKGI